MCWNFTTEILKDIYDTALAIIHHHCCRIGPGNLSYYFGSNIFVQLFFFNNIMFLCYNAVTHEFYLCYTIIIFDLDYIYILSLPVSPYLIWKCPFCSIFLNDSQILVLCSYSKHLTPSSALRCIYNTSLLLCFLNSHICTENYIHWILSIRDSSSYSEDHVNLDPQLYFPFCWIIN